MSISKSLAGIAVLLALAPLSIAQPSRGPIRGSLHQADAQAPYISYRAEGGFAYVKLGLDIRPDGIAFAFEDTPGVKKQQFGTVPAADLQQIRSLVDQLFASQTRSFGSGTMTHTIIRESRGVAMVYETSSPSGIAAQLVQKLQSVADAIVNQPSTLTGSPPVRYLPYGKVEDQASAGSLAASSSASASSKTTGNTDVPPKIIIDYWQPRSRDIGGDATGVGSSLSGASAGPVSKSIGGSAQEFPKIIVDQWWIQGRTQAQSGQVSKGSVIRLGGTVGEIEPVDPPFHHKHQ